MQYVQAGPSVLSNQDFLSRVEAVKADIRTLTTHVGQIASTHQRTLSSPESGSSAQLEGIISQTQVLNTSIKDQIKFLETDAARSKDNQVKNTQISQLKSSFSKQLQEYRQEEANYEKRYREQIARQYRIVNPEASDSEVQEAANADWGNEGVFQTAVSIDVPLSYVTLRSNICSSSNLTDQLPPTQSWAPYAHDTMTSRRSSAPLSSLTSSWKTWPPPSYCKKRQSRTPNSIPIMSRRTLKLETCNLTRALTTLKGHES